MAGSSQPQHFFAEGCILAEFAIAVILYPVIKSFYYLSLWASQLPEGERLQCLPLCQYFLASDQLTAMPMLVPIYLFYSWLCSIHCFFCVYTCTEWLYTCLLRESSHNKLGRLDNKNLLRTHWLTHWLTRRHHF